MPLLEGVTFHVPPSVSAERQLHVSTLLQANGASLAPLTEADYVVTNAFDFEGWQSVPDNAKVVTETWLERTMILGKIQPAQYYSPDPAMLFSGVVACATDLSPPDTEVLSAGITALGGQWRPGLTREVTHLFAVAPGSEKYETAMHYQKDTCVKVLAPHWFDDSVRLGTRGLATKPYEWPEPTVLQPGPRIDGVGASSQGDLKARISGDKKMLYRTALMSPGQEHRLGSVDKGNVWQGRRILLCSDLDLSEGRRVAMEAGIARAGGVIVNSDATNENIKVDEADVLIARYRWGHAYVKAVRANKLIGTLAWIFHVQTAGVVSAPTAQLLHYPIPKKPVEGFSSHEITVTNYTGESREYLKKLITTMGATFTPSMSGRNTVLIAAYIAGNKTTKAGNWSIPVVSHLWLEDCFVQWKNITVGKEKYVNFTPGINFTEMLGERGIGRSVVLDGLLEVEEEMDAARQAFSEGAETNPPPPPSNISAREVEEAMRAVDGMDVEDEPISKKAKAIRPDPDDMEVDEPPAAGNSRQPRPRTLSNASELRRSTRRKSISSVAAPVTSRSEQSSSSRPEAPAEPKNLPEPSKTARKPPVSAHADSARKGKNRDRDPRSDDAAPVAHPKDAPNKTKLRREPIPPRESDDELEVIEDTTVLLKNGESSKLLTSTPPTPKSSQNKTPRRRLSVLLPPIGTGDALFSGSRHRTGKEPSPSRPKLPRPDLGLTSEKEAAGPSTRKRPKPRISAADLSLIQNSPATSRAVGRRAAADKATHKLREEIMPDVRNFEKEMKRGNVRAIGENDGKGARVAKGKAKEVTEEDERKAKGKGLEDVAERVIAKKRMKSRQEAEESADEEERGRKKRRVSTSNAKGKNRAGDDDDDESQSRVTREGRQAAQSSKKAPAHTHEPSDEEQPARKARRASSSARKGKDRAALESDEDEADEDDASVPPKNKGKHKAAQSEHVPKDTARSVSRQDSISEPPDKSDVRVLVTQLSLGEEVTKALTKLGAKMVSKSSECTYLVVKNLGRTEKFLCAMAVAPYVVTEKWALASAAAKQLLPPDRYFLVDSQNEAKYNFKLSQALRRANENGGKLFAGMVFYVTPKVNVDKKLLKNVVAAHGGQIRIQPPTARIIGGKGKNFAISCLEDISIWRPIALAGHTVYSQEVLLTGALTQQLLWSDPQYHVNK